MGLKDKLRQSLRRKPGQPPLMTEDDEEIRLLGGTTLLNQVSPAAVQAAKAPVPLEARIEQLERENSAYKQQIAFLHPLVYNVLLEISPQLEQYAESLIAAVNDCKALIALTNAEWASGGLGRTAEEQGSECWV